MFSSFLAAVQGEDHIHFLTPVREIVFEQEVLHGLESSDQSHVLALILMLCKVGDHTPHWRNTGATCDNNQFLALVVLQIEAISAGAAHQEAVAHIMLENLIGHLSHPADGQIYKSVTDAANGDRSLAVLGDGHLKELSRLHIAPERHAEGVLNVRVLDDLQNFGRKRNIVVSYHHLVTSFMASPSLFTQWEKEMYSGQISSHRPQPTHIW